MLYFKRDSMKTIISLLALSLAVTSCHAAVTTPQKTEAVKDQGLLKLVQQNDLEGLEKALGNGADVNAVDRNKRSLLLIATTNQQAEMAKVLVQYGADVNQQSANQDSPFLYAGASGQTELVALYLNHGARFDVFNRYHGSALIPACERGHVETVRLLANTKGYPINHINRLGWTALMEAVVLGDGSTRYQEITQILKDAGAKMAIPDHNGVTPLQHAQAKGFKEIVNILKP